MTHGINRRSLLRSSAGWAAAAAFGARTSAAPAGRMQVSIQAINLQPNTLRFLKQIGVDHVYLHIPIVPGYARAGYLKDDDLTRVVRRLAEYGLKLAAFHLNNLSKMNLLLGRPGWEPELDNICRTIECMGRGGVPVMLYNMLVSRVLADYTVRGLPGHTVKATGRGGVGLKTFDDKEARLADDSPAGEITAAETWDRFEKFLKRCVPAAEQANVRMALHPDDPPVDRFWGATQVLNSMKGLQRYMDLVPSRANGFDLCQGTLQEAGIDVIELIRTFGRQGRLVEAELRGVRGRIPHYEETFMDEGDLDLTKVVRALKEVGYTGKVEVAHLPSFPGDESRSIAQAWSVGYVKALIASAYSEA